MKDLTFFGKLLFGLSIAGIGVMHFVFSGFQPLVLPITPEAAAHLKMLIYFTAISLTVAGGIIAFGKRVYFAPLFLGIELLLFFVFGHLPNRLKFHPEILGFWTDALKLLALCGGAFIIAKESTPLDTKKNKLFYKWGKAAAMGKYFFALMLVIFGIDHFLYADSVKNMMPGWLPWHLFWTYFSGIALIGSGLAFFIGFKVKMIGLLLALMLFLWLTFLHIPSTISHPVNAINLISSFECMGFCGIAIILSQTTYKTKSTWSI